MQLVLQLYATTQQHFVLRKAALRFKALFMYSPFNGNDMSSILSQRTSQPRLSVQSLIPCSFALLFATVILTSVAFAQDFAVGQTVICKPTGSESDWREGVITENNPKLSYVRIKCGPARNGNPGGIFLVDRRDIKNANDQEAKQKAAGNFSTANTSKAGSNPQVGESVVCLPTGSERDVRTGTVLENNPLYNYVRIQCPPGVDGKPGGIFLVSRTDIRSPNATAPVAPATPAVRPAMPGNTTRVPQTVQNTDTAGNTAIRDSETQQPNANCACAPQTQANSDSIEDNIKRTIIARYVRNGGALDAAHTPSTVHFDSFQIVRQRPYKMPVPGAYYTGSPDGPGGRMGTQVYEVLCKYTVCIDYPGNTKTGYRGRLAVVDHDAGYTCFIDSQGSWRCNQSKDRLTYRNKDK